MLKIRVEKWYWFFAIVFEKDMFAHLYVNEDHGIYSSYKQLIYSELSREKPLIPTTKGLLEGMRDHKMNPKWE